MTKLLTTQYSNFLAAQLQEAIEEQSNTALYVYTGVHGDVIGEIPTPADDTRETVIDAYRNMIFGKRIDAADASLVIRYIPWETGTVFAMYDDNDDDLFEKDFYCCVDEGASIHVYKCLNNNFGLPSTVEPAYTYVDSAAHYMFETSDGYVWKYMYSVSSTVRDKFTTQNYFPVADNANVQAEAIRGAVDVIRIEQNDLEIPGGGKRYDNYFAGTFTSNQLRVNGNNTLYEVSNALLSFQTGYYTGCLLNLSAGTGAGQYSLITDYFHNANGNFVVLEEAFDINPMNGTTYEVYPSVTIRGSGTQTVNTVARALVNATGSNSVYKIEIIERGKDYDFISANIIANGTVTDEVSFVAAELHPVYSPIQGHGTDCAEELGSRAIEFSVRFANTENNTLVAENRYQQIGLLRDPAFSNVFVGISNTSGIFSEGEQVFKISPVRINSNVNISNTSNVITGQSSILSNTSIVVSGATGSYIPLDILDIEGGTALETAQVQVLTTVVRAVTINAVGSGYSAGTFTANLNLGTAVTNATFQVTANSLGQCNSIVITSPGSFTANPPFLANSTPVEGVAGTGLTVKVEMGVGSISIFEPGSYAVIPTDLATNEPVANAGDGTGVQLLIAFTGTLSADFLHQLSPNDYVYITSSDLTQQQLAVVNTVTNATYLTITTNGFFSCAAALMFQPHIIANAEIIDASNTSVVVLSAVDQELTTGDLLVGLSSGAKAQVNTIARNGDTKNFDSFIQLYKYNITTLSSDFIENEIIYQGDSLANATASALIHSVVTVGESTLLYTSNQVGQFVDTSYVQGVNSFAVATINESFSPELEFGSGEVLYIENMDAVNRANDQSEVFQIIIGF